MKKKLIALALILLLAMTMTAVAFAGQTGHVPDNTCPVCLCESYNAGSIVIVSHTHYSGYQHTVNYYVPQICSNCTHLFNAYGSYEEVHDGDPCVKCGYPNFDR